MQIMWLTCVVILGFGCIGYILILIGQTLEEIRDALTADDDYDEGEIDK